MDLKRREILHFQVKPEKHQGSNFLKVTPDCVKVFSTSLKTKVLKLHCMGKLALGSLFKKQIASSLPYQDCQGWSWAFCTLNRYHKV